VNNVRTYLQILGILSHFIQGFDRLRTTFQLRLIYCL